MGRITPICKLTAALLCCAAPAYASVEDNVTVYANARAAEFDARHGEALAGYLKLFEESADSETLAKRVYQSAVRQGDFAAALQAIRVQELKNDVPPEGPLILFTDAFQKRRWSMALVAADELEARSNFGFMAPILRAWVSVAKTGTHDLTLKEGNSDPFFNFYALDQIVYLDLATGQNAKAKLGLRNMVSVGGDAMRDLYIEAAPVVAKNGDTAFANAMLGTALGSEFNGQPHQPATIEPSISPNIGLAALYVRVATSLIEQDLAEPGLALARLAQWTAPNYAPAIIATAKALGELSGGREAVALLDKIPSSSPYWTRTVFAKAALLRDIGDNSAAVELARLSYSQNNISAARATFLGQMLQQDARLPEAIAQYRSAMDLEDFKRQAPKGRASFHVVLASALDENGNWDEAQKELQNAIKLDPSNASALNYLGYSMLERGDDVVQAESLVRRAYEAEPGSSAYADSLGWALFKNGKFDDAVAMLEKAATAAKGDATIFEHLGDAYWRAGRRREARYAWNSAQISAETADVLRISTKLDAGLPGNIKSAD
ncbi:MAG: tetratricopeptide repeat protein [Sphingorhabdus sp.]